MAPGRYAGKAYVISSTDGGATWTSRDLNDDFYAFVDVWFENPMHGYITGTNLQGRASLVETHDGGLTWTTRKTNQSGHYWKMGFASTDFGYAVCSGGADMDIWVQTHDGGGTWVEAVVHRRLPRQRHRIPERSGGLDRRLSLPHAADLEWRTDVGAHAD